MKKLVYFGALTIFLLGSSQVYAAGSVAAGAKIGTLGAGADLSLQVASSLNARLGIQGLSYNTEETESGIDYDAKLKLFSGLVTADWFPFSNGFRLSPGLVANGNELDLNGRPEAGTTFDIGGETYTVDDVGSLDGNVDFNSLAPYLGLGWGNPFGAEGNWSFSCDIGVVFQGSPNVTLTATPTAAFDDPALRAELDRRVAAEERDLEDDLEPFKYYPVVSIGITYRF